MVLHGAPLRVRPRAKDTQRQEDGRVWAVGQPACGQPGRRRRGAAQACRAPERGCVRLLPRRGQHQVHPAGEEAGAKPRAQCHRTGGGKARLRYGPCACRQPARRCGAISVAAGTEMPQAERFKPQPFFFSQVRPEVHYRRSIRPLNSPWQADRAVGRA